VTDDLEGLRSALRVLREQEGEALREAAELRAAGRPFDEVQAKAKEAEGLRARINAVVRDIEARQLH
jgi:hypothetical protein